MSRALGEQDGDEAAHVIPPFESVGGCAPVDQDEAAPFVDEEAGLAEHHRRFKRVVQLGTRFQAIRDSAGVVLGSTRLTTDKSDQVDGGCTVHRCIGVKGVIEIIVTDETVLAERFTEQRHELAALPFITDVDTDETEIFHHSSKGALRRIGGQLLHHPDLDVSIPFDPWTSTGHAVVV